MDKSLINLSKRLYEYKRMLDESNKKHNRLSDRVTVNEEEVNNLMTGLVEICELVLGDTVMSNKISSAIPKVYAALIKKDLKTIEDVPESVRSEVESLLENGENSEG